MGQIYRLNFDDSDLVDQYSDSAITPSMLEWSMKVRRPSEFGLTPIHYKKIKMVVPIYGNSMWKRIKDKLGFKDDHADKNYQQ